MLAAHVVVIGCFIAYGCLLCDVNNVSMMAPTMKFL